MKKIILLLIISVSIFRIEIFSQSGQNCFTTQFNNSATNLDLNNAYLLAYLSTMSYPDYLRFREPSPVPGPESYFVQFFQHRNDTFIRKFADKLAYLFYAPSQQTTLSNLTIKEPINLNLPSPNVLLNLNSLIKKEPNVITIGGVTFDFQYRCNSDGYDPEAIIISTPITVYVIFRGTDRVACNNEGSIKGKLGYAAGEWIGTNFKFLKRSWPKINGEVHRGFIESLDYGGFADSVASRIKNRYGGANKKVWITGHSLGGAHAQLFALLAKLNWGIQAQGLYLYASPHPGDGNFVTQLNNVIGKNRIQRFEFLDDPVPTLPPQMPPFSYGRAGVRNNFKDITIMNSGAEQIPVWDDGKLACGLANLALSSSINLEIVYGCGGAFCYHHPTWLLKGLRNKLPTSLYASLPVDVPLPLGGEGFCTQNQVTMGKNNNLFILGADIIEAGIKDAIDIGIETVENITWQAKNFLDNFTGSALSEGNYEIVNCKPNPDKLTKLTWRDVDRDDAVSGSTLRTWIIGSDASNNIFKIEKQLSPGYRIKMPSGKNETDWLGNSTGKKIEFCIESPAIDNDNQTLFQNGCDANMQSINTLWGGQTWLFYKVKDPNYYIIINALSGKVLDANDTCSPNSSCKVKTWDATSNNQSQVWRLIKK